MARFAKELSAKITELAKERAAKGSGKYKSNRRYFERIFTKTGTQKIQKPRIADAGIKAKVAEIKAVEIAKEVEARPKEIKRSQPKEYPETVKTGAAIFTEPLPNPVRGESVDAEENTTITVKARFHISRDNTFRAINLDCSPGEARKIVNAKSLFDAVAQWTKTNDGYFLQGATISEIEYIEIN